MPAADYQIDSWTTENGLPQNVICDVCQTGDGYLWLATLDGLVQFDGLRFVVKNRSNTQGIGGNRFSSLLCTSDGGFWAGTEFSGITRQRDGRFVTYTTRQGLPSNHVPGITGDQAGHTWVLSGTSLARWDETQSRFVKFAPEQAANSYFAGGQLSFWGLDGKWLDVFARGQFLRYLLPPNWPRDTLGAGMRDLGGRVWLTAANGRLAEFSGAGQTMSVKEHLGGAEHANPDDLTSSIHDSRGNVWNFGVASDAGTALIQYLRVASQGRTERIVFSSFFQDREGSIWLGTDGHGLYRLRRQTISSLSEQDGLPDRNVYPIYQDPSGVIWVGTWSGGLARFHNGKFTTFSAAQGLPARRINSIFQDRDGVLWVASNSQLYCGSRGRFVRVANEILRAHQAVQVIFQDREGTLWFGTPEGLLRYRNGSWSVLTTKDGLAGNDTRVIIEGRAGNLWIGGYGGLTSLNHAHFRQWTEADGLPSNSIRSLYEDGDGVLWIGTYDSGLGRLENGKLTRYSVRDGLFNGGVFQILEDSRGYFWMSCNRGIYRVSKRDLNDFAKGKRTYVTSIAYGKSDGMQSAECNGGLWPAGIRARNGQLWFPTQGGVAVINPERVQVNSRPPPVVIEAITVDRGARATNEPVRVSPGQQDLEIQYTALSFLDSNEMQFRYQLVGLDRDWVQVSTRRTAYYSHLPHGEYDFRVIAANSDGVWNMQGQQVHVSVLPAYYQTWWFLFLCILGGAGAVSLAWRRRVSYFENARELQERFARRLIASQESERKRIAAELHDSLGQHMLIIKNWATLALRGLNGTASAEEALNEISGTASLAIDEVRAIAYNLRPYQLEKLGLTTAIQDLVSQVATTSNICFTTKLDHVDGAFDDEVELSIYRFVQESLNNIVRHSQATEARVQVTQTDDLVSLTVYDDGRGFNPPDMPHPSRGGFGLIGMAERARLTGGQVSIESAPGAGTTITMSLRIR